MVSAPFRERVLFLFGRSKRFRAEDHLPVPLASAIQTFLCGGSRLPFGSGLFQSRHSLRLPLSLVLTPVAIVTGTVGSPLDCRFRDMSFVCMTRSVLVSTVRTLVQSLVCGSVARGFFFLWFSCLSYVCCDVVAIRCCLLCFRWYWPSLEGSMDWARAYLRNAPVHALGPGLVQAEA